MSRFDFSRLLPSSATQALLTLHLCFGAIGCTNSSPELEATSKSGDSIASTETASHVTAAPEAAAKQTIDSAASGAGETKSTSNEKTAAETVAGLPNISEDAFLQAALDGDASIVKRGIRQGIRVDFTAEDKRTALMLAAFNGHTSIVKHLLEHNATVDLRDSIQRTALMYAATGSSVETVQLLVDAGANVNAADAEESWTPLMMAAAEGQTQIVAVLLKHGANAASKDVDGETALQFAASKGHQAVVELLSK